MLRIPGLGEGSFVETGAIGVSDHRDALTALGPVAARAILASGKRGSVGLRARKNVVHVRRIAASIDDVAFLGERGLFGEIVGAMQLGNVLRDDDAFGICPWSAPDAVAGAHGTRALRAQVSVPGFAAGARGLRQRLAMPIGAFEPAEIGALANRCAGDEEAHVALLRLRNADCAECDERTRSDDANLCGLVHAGAPVVVIARKRTDRRDSKPLMVRGLAPIVVALRSHD